MFDSTLVRRAIDANRPDLIVLNHLDYVDSGIGHGCITRKAANFVEMVEQSIARRINYVGTGPSSLFVWRQIVSP
jgi:adenylosuccinate synthase